MPMDRIHWKKQAREAMSRANGGVQWVTMLFLGMTVLVSALIFSAVRYVMPAGAVPLSGGAPAAVWVLNLLVALYDLLVLYGYLTYCRRLVCGERPGWDSLLEGFGNLGRLIRMNLLRILLIFLWSLLLILPGIVAGYRYRMADYVLMDDPACGALEALRRSKRLTEGQKVRLFALDLSFFPWVLLLAAAAAVGIEIGMYWELPGILLGCGGSAAVILWLLPYLGCANAAYYESMVELQWRPNRRERNRK